VGCEKLSASSFVEHSLRLERRQERDMPMNRATGDNVKIEMQTTVLAVRQRYASLGSSEILVLASPFGTMGRFDLSCLEQSQLLQRLCCQLSGQLSGGKLPT